MKTRIGVAGYGNIGRGAEKALARCPDMELAAVFTRRDPRSLAINTPGVPVLPLDGAESAADGIDVMLLCGGSATDLPEQGPRFAAAFNTVDSFDTHARIPEYFAMVDRAAANHTAVIAAGWDPGLFSLVRALSGAILPDGADYTFWGPGVSQGHSEAIRHVKGVKYAVQYTLPVEKAVAEVKSGSRPALSAGQKHTRECFVTPMEGADLAGIEAEIRNMPNYFAGYDTSVRFISEEEFLKNHAAMPHGGSVIRSGNTGANRHTIEFSLKLDSNPEFTGAVLVAYARAAARMAREGSFGAKTALDVPVSYLSPKDGEALRRELV